MTEHGKKYMFRPSLRKCQGGVGGKGRGAAACKQLDSIPSHRVRSAAVSTCTKFAHARGCKYYNFVHSRGHTKLHDRNKNKTGSSIPYKELLNKLILL